MNYTIDYFINKFNAIPENRIIAYAQDDYQGGHCALGWCKNDLGQYGDASVRNKYNYSEEAVALRDIFMKAGIHSLLEEHGWTIANINNGDHPDYQQSTPKQRILAALYDAKKMQEDPEGDQAIKEANEIISTPVEEPETV